MDIHVHVVTHSGGASKAGLKDAKSRKHKRKAKKEETEESSPGNLLTDLSAALGRRRKAMSGKDNKPREREERKEDHSLGGGSMMDNISKMIPAPPSAQREESTEDHSDDEGAW